LNPTNAPLNLPGKTSHSSLGAAPASVQVAPDCSRKTACVSPSQRGIRTNRSCRILIRRTASTDTRAMQANQRQWSYSSRMLLETLGLLRWSCTTLTAGLPAFFVKGLPKPTQAWRSTQFGTPRSARFWLGQQAARLMLENKPNANGTKGTIIFTNASAALKGFPLSGAFAMARHARSGLANTFRRGFLGGQDNAALTRAFALRSASRIARLSLFEAHTAKDAL